jgi:hypothetical protein
MAGDSKIWIAALFMLVSFIFNAIKKKRKAEKEALEGQEVEPQNPNTSWGVEDLISQFEQKYGVETEPKHSGYHAPNDTEMEDDISDYEDEKVIQNPAANNTEETNSHSAFTRDKNTKLSDDLSYQSDTETDVSKLNLDLRNLVISNTILERPKF